MLSWQGFALTWKFVSGVKPRASLRETMKGASSLSEAVATSNWAALPVQFNFTRSLDNWSRTFLWQIGNVMKPQDRINSTRKKINQLKKRAFYEKLITLLTKQIVPEERSQIRIRWTFSQSRRKSVVKMTSVAKIWLTLKLFICYFFLQKCRLINVSAQLGCFYWHYWTKLTPDISDGTFWPLWQERGFKGAPL